VPIIIVVVTHTTRNIERYTTSKPKYDSLVTSKNPSLKHRSNKNHESHKTTKTLKKYMKKPINKKTLCLEISNHQK
jgi:hypothetical protein